MKTFLAFFLILVCHVAAFAQAPQRFKYQGVARDASGNVLMNQALGLKISILTGSSSGPVAYSETHTTVTNQFGLFNIQVGGGVLVAGNFAGINWGNAVHFVQVEMDATGGTSYTLMGSSQLLSVPYALNAASVSQVDWTAISNIPADIADGDGDILASLNCSANQVALYNGSSWICANLPNSTTGQDITDVYGSGQLVLTTSSTNYTLVPGLSQTITVPANAKVHVQTNGGIQTVGTGNTYGIADFAFFVDGIEATPGGHQRVVAANTTGLGNMLNHWSFGKTFSLTAGSHTIQVRAKDGGGTADVNVSGTNSLIQGVLTVTIIKL